MGIFESSASTVAQGATNLGVSRSFGLNDLLVFEAIFLETDNWSKYSLKSQPDVSHAPPSINQSGVKPSGGIGEPGPFPPVE